MVKIGVHLRKLYEINIVLSLFLDHSVYNLASCCSVFFCCVVTVYWSVQVDCHHRDLKHSSQKLSLLVKKSHPRAACISRISYIFSTRLLSCLRTAWLVTIPLLPTDQTMFWFCILLRNKKSLVVLWVIFVQPSDSICSSSFVTLALQYETSSSLKSTDFPFQVVSPCLASSWLNDKFIYLCVKTVIMLTWINWIMLL